LRRFCEFWAGELLMGKIILITGGARSGKSAFAEKLAGTGGKRVAYIATAEIWDDEMAERVELHRQRRPADWLNFEAPRQAETAIAAASRQADVILFDCLTVYSTNALLAQGTESKPFERREAVLEEIRKLVVAAKKMVGMVIFVTNEVGDGIVPDNALAREFRDVSGLVNQKVAQAADEVYWVVCGLPVEIKRQATVITEGLK
jgi:adenosylcobinamide kinase/adenosylcobinamide-phosphate guanylyltransferase